MKQEIISYIHSLKNELYNLSKYLYDNPEDSFHEYKAHKYISNILIKNDFIIENNFLNIPTAFYAQYGAGHPKICYFCEYDAIPDKGHLSGHNLLSSMSIGAALGLKKVLGKLQGTVILIGSPGEYMGGTKLTIAKQGFFDDMDIAMMAHPDIITAQSGTSAAVLPLSIKYMGEGGLSFMMPKSYSSLDASLFTFTSLNLLSKGFPSDVALDGMINNNSVTPSLIPGESDLKLYIRGKSTDSTQNIESKIRLLTKMVSSLMDIPSEVSYYEVPYDELITNTNLSRIFSHNLKESGIIDCHEAKNTSSALSLGTVSHYVPSIHPYIGITDDKSVTYFSEEFARCTLSEFAQNRMLQTAYSLAITGLDIIQSENLLSEIKKEFYVAKTE
jgi:metal-dependent amidase/aminoacylase/carboxypeptidase family protein